MNVTEKMREAAGIAAGRAAGRAIIDASYDVGQGTLKEYWRTVADAALTAALTAALQADADLRAQAPAEGEQARRLAEQDWQAIEDAALLLVRKMAAIHASPIYRSVLVLAQIHAGPYTGPTYDQELQELRKALGLPYESIISAAPSPSTGEPSNAGEAPGPSTLAADLSSSASASRRGEPAPDRSIPCPTCGFHIKHTERKPFVIEDDGPSPAEGEIVRELREAVARGWCHDANRHKEMDPDLAEAIVQEVCAALSRSTTGGPQLAPLPTTTRQE